MEKIGGIYMNLIPMIREALGLEIEEEFQLLKSDGTSYNSKYCFAYNDTLQWFDPGTGCWNSDSPITLQKIIYGQVTIKKQPFKPKEFEFYYYVSLYTGRVVRDRYTENNDANRAQVKSGNCYRTKEEAEKHVDEWMSKVYGKDWRELLK